MTCWRYSQRRCVAGLDHPAGLAELAREVVRRHAGPQDPGDQRLVVIADQFEEIFGPDVDRERREAFLAAMQAATAWPDDGRPPAVLVVASLRADFYGRALSEPFLALALAGKRTFDITPMTREELRDVVTKPAAMAGMAVEPELVDRILADLQAEDLGSSTGHDTRLPLLSHALLATWRHREGAMLTLRGYQAAGGVGGAVAHGAGQFWSGGGAGQQASADGDARALTEEERDIVRRLLLQLVYVGPAGTELVRRRDPLRELAEALGGVPDEPDRMQLVSQVLGRLVTARLVMVDRDHAEIVHDALLRTWPQLREWIDADRVNLVIGRQIAEAADEWDRLGRHRGDLYAGSRLDAARQWESAARQMPARVADFLRRSKQAARARRQGLAAGITVLLLSLTLIATLLVVSLNELGSVRARTDALESAQLAASASTIASSDPELARELALSAYRLSPSDHAAQALAAAAVTPSPAEIDVGGHAVDVAYSPQGSLLAVASTREGGTVSLWKNAESGLPSPAGVLPVHHKCVLAFIPGTWILAPAATPSPRCGTSGAPATR